MLDNEQREVIQEYLDQGDVAKENANMDFGPSGLLFSTGGHALKQHNLEELRRAGFTQLVRDHQEGYIHIHDLSLGVCVPYCAGHSLSNLLDNGMEIGIKSAPAKNLDSAINHMVNYIGSCSNDFAGAQAFNDVDVWLAPYAYKQYLDFKKEGCSRVQAFKLTRRAVYQSIQSFVFHLNYNTRWGNQSPFSNISLAITVPEDMQDRPALVGGRLLADHFDYKTEGIKVNNETYGDLSEWQRLVAEAILDVLIAGDADGKSFTFPVLTLNVDEGFFDHTVLPKIVELTRKFGYPFFQNFRNGVSGGKRMDPKDVRAMCCRLNLDLNEVAAHTGGHFGAGDNTGSLQVVTLSLPMFAREALNWAEPWKAFFNMLEEVMWEIRQEMVWKRSIVEDYFQKEFFKLAYQNMPNGFQSFFCTFGFIGLWEAVEILTGDKESFLSNDSQLDDAARILTFMRGVVNKYMQEDGALYNLEATPAEGATYKLAKKALEIFPDMPTRGTPDSPYFTNSHHIPVEYQDDLEAVFKTQTVLQTIPTGGTVQHFTIGEELSYEEVVAAIRTITETAIPYFSINTVFSVCPICGYVGTAVDYCPNAHTEASLTWLKENKPEMIEDGDTK